MEDKVVYEDSTRKVVKEELKSEANPNGMTKYGPCNNKHCKREAHYRIRGIVEGWSLGVCEKHMKTMTAETVKSDFTKIDMENIRNFTRPIQIGNKNEGSKERYFWLRS